MTYIIYADYILICNIIINIFLLCIISKILNISINIKRILAWSVLIGFISLLEYIFTINSNIIMHYIIYATIYYLMITLYFKKNCVHKTLIVFIAIISISILYGLIQIFKVHYLTSYCYFLYISFFTILIIIIFNQINHKKKVLDNEYNVTLHIGKKTITETGYLDTGNLLIDIYNNSPVIILDYRLMRKIIPMEAYAYIQKYHQTGIFDYENISKKCKLRFYPIPYRTLSTDMSFIPVFKVDELIFENKNIKIKNISAGISRNKLINKYNYQILLNENIKINKEDYSND